MICLWKGVDSCIKEGRNVKAVQSYSSSQCVTSYQLIVQLAGLGEKRGELGWYTCYVVIVVDHGWAVGIQVLMVVGKVGPVTTAQLYFVVAAVVRACMCDMRGFMHSCSFDIWYLSMSFSWDLARHSSIVGIFSSSCSGLLGFLKGAQTAVLSNLFGSFFILDTDVVSCLHDRSFEN